MIGEVLRRTRREQGRSLADVSRAARVSVPYLSEVERGRKEASSEVLAAICDALRIGLPGLLAGVERELAGAERGLARVVRLDSEGVRGAGIVRLPTEHGPRGTSPQARGTGDAVCLLAA